MNSYDIRDLEKQFDRQIDRQMLIDGLRNAGFKVTRAKNYTFVSDASTDQIQGVLNNA